MKIDGYDVDTYLRGIDTDEILENSVGFRRVPSQDRRHIKSLKKVSSVLEEMNKNNECNLYTMLKSKWEDSMDNIMIYYRNNTKTASEIFEEVDKMAMAFDEMGLNAQDQIVACMSSVPEVLVLLLAASKCGLIVNFISDKFNKNYIRKIFKQTPERKLFIATDDRYSKLEDLVLEAGFKDKVVVSLVNSLDGVDPFDKVDSKVVKFVDRVPYIKKRDKFVMSYSELLDISSKWNGFDNGFARRTFYPASNALNMPLTITYVIDDTIPKQIVHSNKSYISMARFCDSDLTHVKKIDGVVSLAYVPTHLNSYFSTGMINILSQGGALAFEPIYHPNFLLYSMAINKPTNVYATRSMLIDMAKRMNKRDDIAEHAFGDAVIVAAIDELPSKSEEKFINKALKNADAGGEILSKLVGPTTLSIVGGTLEHGNIFFTVMKDRCQKITAYSEAKEDFGLVPYQLSSFAILDDGGRECSYEEYGRLVVKSDSTMLGYLTEKDNKMFRLMDNEGRVWTDTNCFGAVLKNGNVIQKGKYDDVIELENGQKIPYFMISDKLLETDFLLSCEVVKPECDLDALVAHVEVSPEEANVCPEWIEIVLGEVERKAQQSFSEELAKKIVYKVIPSDKSYPLTNDGKRDLSVLRASGIEGCYKPDIDCCEVEMIPADTYFTSSKPKVKEK